MTKHVIDISIRLEEGMPVWPGSAGFHLERYKSMASGAAGNTSRLACDVHVGTHVDAPIHFIADGTDVADMRLEDLIGPCVVAELSGVDRITAADLDGLAIPPTTRRLLLRTRNSALWAAGVREFRTDFVALTRDAASWVVDHGIRLIGVDYLSVQRYHDDCATHRILLGAGVAVLEGLDLSAAVPGSYELICLPLRLVGADGAPARAVLRPLQPEVR
ncbi:MAG: cyclase family protein [Deltaproteobacteria bacterium]|nr:cyclase family protein [Deltaproteobacteria bacterium]